MHPVPSPVRMTCVTAPFQPKSSPKGCNAAQRRVMDVLATTCRLTVRLPTGADKTSQSRKHVPMRSAKTGDMKGSDAIGHHSSRNDLAKPFRVREITNRVAYV
jgi:hypothetical protein